MLWSIYGARAGVSQACFETTGLVHTVFEGTVEGKNATDRLEYMKETILDVGCRSE